MEELEADTGGAIAVNLGAGTPGRAGQAAAAAAAGQRKIVGLWSHPLLMLLGEGGLLLSQLELELLVRCRLHLGQRVLEVLLRERLDLTQCTHDSS